ncbi:MAG: hypothetical protein V3R90_00505 [Limibaculum sp.]
MKSQQSRIFSSCYRHLSYYVPVACAVLATSIGLANAHEMPALSPELEAVRASVEKYKDPIVAVRDGYHSTVACIEGANGAMGVHLINGQFIVPEPDPMRPAVLVYEPVGGKLELVGVEWLAPAPPESEKPHMFGREMHGPMDGHEPLMPKEVRHYDLHAWIFKANPAGVFESWNADVTCDAEPGYTIMME